MGITIQGNGESRVSRVAANDGRGSPCARVALL